MRWGGRREAEGAPGKEKGRRRKDERRETSSMEFIRAQEKRGGRHLTPPDRLVLKAEYPSQPSFSRELIGCLGGEQTCKWGAASQDAQSSCSESIAKHQSLRQHNEAALGCGST